MTKKVYGLMVDCGDGSAYVQWYDDYEKVESLLNDDEHCEEYWMNDGSAIEFTFPEDLDLVACGFRIREE